MNSQDARDELTPAERAALKRLDDADFGALDLFFEEFKGESDRAAVVLGAAQIDELLRQMIEKVLLPDPKTGDDDPLLGRDRPLSTFSSRITAARRLGLVDAEFARSLDVIRKIRNSFAHRIDSPALDRSPHREWIAQLRRPPSATFWRLLVERFGPRSSSTELRAALATMAYFLRGSLENIVRLSPQPLTAANMTDTWPRVGAKEEK